VRDVGYSTSSESIVAAVIALASGMGLRLIAEGVEEVDQVRCLRRLGCHMMQGFLFSRPLPADDAFRYLSRAARV
jgi:EAL domain-containing protein (putative c-di-GMP-specific phosphodiesterase class I)